jgi:hypothetical protein
LPGLSNQKLQPPFMIGPMIDKNSNASLSNTTITDNKNTLDSIAKRLKEPVKDEDGPKHTNIISNGGSLGV